MRFDKLLIVIAVVSLLVFATGCDLFKAKPKDQQPTPPPAAQPPAAQEQQQTAPPAAAPPSKPLTPPPSAKPEAKGLSALFQYDKIKEYEYRITSSAAGQIITSNIKVKVQSDTLEGKAVWLTSTDVESQGVTSTTKTWIDKAAYKCLKITSETQVMGQTYSNTVACPEFDPTQVDTKASAGDGQSKMVLVGQESVTVPAGTFNANKYTYEGKATYWMGTEVPLPLKMDYSVSGASSLMELVSYS